MKNKSFLFSVCVILVTTISITMLSSGIYAQQPSVKTTVVKNITSTTAESGYIINATGVPIIKHGICLGKGPGPTTRNLIYAADKAPGPAFNVQLTGLTPGMKFYIRSFITTSSETIYGNEFSFTTSAPKK